MTTKGAGARMRRSVRRRGKRRGMPVRAVVLLDRHGNSIERRTLPFPDCEALQGRARAIIGESVREIVDLAKSRGVAFAIEDLDFRGKKAGLREYGAAHARGLSEFANAAFQAMVASRCEREGVRLEKVDPAFTRVIGRMKYARWRSMTVHHAAALAIGRAAMGFGERQVSMDGAGLDAPGRMRPRIDRRRWRGVRKLAREAKVVRTARLGKGISAKGVPKGTAPASSSGRASGRRRTLSVLSQIGDAVAPAISVKLQPIQ